jgi:hypothetical protein
MYIRNDCGAKVASKVKVKVKGAEVISIMNSMGRSCPLLWCKYESKLSPIMTACTTWVLTMFSEILMLDVLICLCVLMGKSYLYIYIYIFLFDYFAYDLNDVWFGCAYIRMYILWSCGIYICFYDQVMMSIIFIYDWCYVLTCLYTYILRSCEISICSYNQAMRALIYEYVCIM